MRLLFEITLMTVWILWLSRQTASKTRERFVHNCSTSHFPKNKTLTSVALHTIRSGRWHQEKNRSRPTSGSWLNRIFKGNPKVHEWQSW